MASSVNTSFQRLAPLISKVFHQPEKSSRFAGRNLDFFKRVFGIKPTQNNKSSPCTYKEMGDLHGHQVGR